MANSQLHLSIRSRIQKRDEGKRHLVVTNGEITETGYFDRLNELSMDTVLPVFENNKLPSKLVEAAISRQAKTEENSFDTVSVVCDLDDLLDYTSSKRDVDKAIKLARENNVLLCFSNESFEIWLICHAGQEDLIENKLKSRKESQAVARRLGFTKGKGGKIVESSKVNAKSVADAISIAEALRSTYGAEIVSSIGPMTDVDQLVKRISMEKKYT